MMLSVIGVFVGFQLGLTASLTVVCVASGIFQSAILVALAVLGLSGHAVAPGMLALAGLALHAWIFIELVAAGKRLPAASLARLKWSYAALTLLGAAIGLLLTAQDIILGIGLLFLVPPPLVQALVLGLAAGEARRAEGDSATDAS